MSSRYEAFCNNSTDLQAILSTIDSYDRKRVLPPNWVAEGTANVYQLNNSGFCSVLFKDGQDLGSEAGSKPAGDNGWRYQEATDNIQFYLASSSTSALNSIVFEGGQDWDDLKGTVCKEQADRIRSFLNRPVYKRKRSQAQGASERNYDWILVRCNAALAVADLIRSYDSEKAEDIESRITNPEGDGLLDRLRRKEYVLWNETSWRTEGGVIQDVSVNANTTGVIEDVKLIGPPGVDWDDVRVSITTGGTFQSGTTSPVYYQVKTKNDSGIGMNTVLSAQQVDGSYQSLAYGAKIRFSEGLYTASDSWSIIFQSSDLPIGSVKSAQIYR
tara:strand:+ start:471 stop:1457 length:987 start_codon:yes stop_codon:yes gene_type:complete